MTKLIAFVLAASLCIGSASAVDVYDLERDTQLLSLDKSVSTASADDSWYDSVLQDLEWMMFDIDSIQNLVDSIYLDTGDISEYLYDISRSLGVDFDETIYAMIGSLTEYLADTAGWLGVYDSGLQLNELLLLLDSSVSGFSLAFDNWVARLNLFLGENPLSSYFILSSGFKLDATGLYSWQSEIPFVNVVSDGFVGLANQFMFKSGVSYLTSSGDISFLPGDTFFNLVVSNGFMGLSSNIKSISSGSYALQLFDSASGESVMDSAATMGEMIHKYFDSIQDDLGALTYLYADEEMVQSKKDAAENIQAADEGFLAPDSVAGVSASDLGDAADAVGSTKELFDTGVSPGQAFKQLQGSGPLEFFTSVTASNLNTVPATYSDDDDFVHFYDPSNSEFFELIGKGGD